MSKAADRGLLLNFAAAPRSAVYIFVSHTSNSGLGEAGLSMSAGGDLCDEV